MKITIASLAALAACAGLIAGCGGGNDNDQTDTTASVPAAKLTPCDINGRQQELGASYVTSIEVSGVKCQQAEAVIKAYHQCRFENGGPGGTCDAPVQGFECTEANRQEVPGVQFLADVDCRRAEAQIHSSYTQNF
jgi:hypothetical protein